MGVSAGWVCPGFCPGSWVCSRVAGWGFWLVRPPFSDSASWPVVGCGVAGWNMMGLCGLGWGLARCWVLRGHLFVVGVVLGPLLASVSNASGFLTGLCGWGFGCGGAGGVGVWLCVECCIVDASILLWSSV
jgi:hypothetical protein